MGITIRRVKGIFKTVPSAVRLPWDPFPTSSFLNPQDE
jgi:hypothetical protein